MSLIIPPSRLLPCLTNVIGLSRTDCICTESGRPADAAASTSGLYLDELPGGISFEAVRYATACAGLWGQMAAARQQAAEIVQDDITRLFGVRQKQRKQPYTGKIGGDTATGLLPGPSRPVMGMRLQPAYMRDAALKITKLGLWLDASLTAVQWYIYKAYRNSGYPPVQVASGVIDTQVNQISTNPDFQPISLPLSDENMRPLEYFVLYTSGGARAYNNITSCNCGANERLLGEYMDLAGVTGNGYYDFTAMPANGYANGVVMQAEITCSVNHILCQNMKDNPEITISVANAVWNKAGEILIESVLNSEDVSRYTMRDREYNWGKRNKFRADYQTYAAWTAENLSLAASDCYSCGDDRVFKGTIFS